MEEKGKAENVGDKTPDKTLKSVPHSSNQTSTLASPEATCTPKAKKAKNGIFPPDASLFDAHKKMLRAKRFGIPANAMPLHQHKLKPKRFMMMMMIPPVYDMPPSTAYDDRPKKKKARLAHFSPVSKIGSLEEEKWKARAIRFANPPSSSLPEADRKGDIEPKETVAVKLPDRPEWLLGSLVIGNFIV